MSQLNSFNQSNLILIILKRSIWAIEGILIDMPPKSNGNEKVNLHTQQSSRMGGSPVDPVLCQFQKQDKKQI